MYIDVRCRYQHTMIKFTYDIVSQHMISYINVLYRILHTILHMICTDMRHRKYLHTYDIIYDMFSSRDTIFYVIHTISYVDIRYRINIWYRTSNIVCPWKQYRIHYIVYTIWYTTSNTWYTIWYIWTYNIVGDLWYRMWQESTWHSKTLGADTLS